MSMVIETRPWDITEFLDSDEAIAAYLEAVFEDGDLDEIRAAIGHAARARGMSDLAAKSGITRAGLYKALGEGGNPSFATMMVVLKALGVRLSVTSAGDDPEAVAA
jgi:probable addiction module antidote protein